MSGTHEFNPENLTYGSENEQSNKRLRELMLFVADRCQDDPKFGITKLNKILYYCDSIAFAKYGRSITGISYNKLSFGPVPTGAENTRRRMERDEDVVMSSPGHSFRPRRMIPLREADLTLFTGPEIALVDSIIEEFSEATGSQLRDYSHGRAWRAVDDFERIPYEAALVSDLPLAERDIEAGHAMADEYECFMRTKEA